MLRSLKDLKRYTINALDGDIGNVVCFLIDEDAWSIPWLVVRTGGPVPFAGHRVMISRDSFGEVGWSTQLFQLNLTRDEVESSPSTVAHSPDAWRTDRELRGFRVEGTDRPVGHIDDFIVDDESWHVRYFVVDTGNWLVGKRVLVAPDWSRVSRSEEKVFVGVSREAIRSSPPWHSERAIAREYEERLHAHYGRPTYWAGRGFRETALSSF